ncbi:MAG: hypothetical protein R3B40_11035 [Polyangiales bacterium]|nr:hypothetical protein [Myxococcales bacterium]MCB9658013.1 hypothetical protein [Sandaracinaceae bacterium]
MRHVAAPGSTGPSPLWVLLAALCALSSVPSVARADFGSSDPGDWVRNRCVARNVMVAGLLTAPVGLLMFTNDAEPGRVALGATLLAGSGGTLATGITLRALQPDAPSGINTPAAEWERDGCLLRSVAIYGGPVMALGTLVFINSFHTVRNPFTRVVGRIMAVTGFAMIAGGLTMTLYGSIKVRRRERPTTPLDLGAPLIAVPTRAGAVSIGVGSLGFSGSF